MTYYDELGLAPDASPEQIRQAYHNLVRLLHPDQQQDEELRKLADSQLKRWNTIIETLLDADRRWRYDESLDRRAEPVRLPRLPGARWGCRIRVNAVLWVAASAMAAAMLVWSITGGGGAAGPPIRSADETPAPAPAVQPLPLRRNPAMRPQAPPAGLKREAAPAGEALPAAEPPRAEPDLAALPELRFTAPAPPAERKRSALTGTWYYEAGPRRAEPSTSYPPEYIEMVVSEEPGRLSGRYRARYRVTDRAISPQVAFEFTGSGANPAEQLRWTSGGGGSGEVRLKLLSPGTVQVIWWATRLGPDTGLVSGSAVLRRRGEEETSADIRR